MVTVPNLGNMNPFQFLFEKDSQSSIKGCLLHNMRKWQVTGQILSLYFIAWSKTWRFCCLLSNSSELFREYLECPFHSFICGHALFVCLPRQHCLCLHRIHKVMPMPAMDPWDTMFNFVITHMVQSQNLGMWEKVDSSWDDFCLQCLWQ